MNARRALLLLAMALMTASACSKRIEPAKAQAEKVEKENEQPREDEIGEDCVAFVRATKVIAAQEACAGCNDDGAEVLSFRQMRVDRISCSVSACEVVVTLQVIFNPAARGPISGGLTAWIPQEQRAAYRQGQAPDGEQVYRVKITYKRAADKWRAIEFDRGDAQ